MNLVAIVPRISPVVDGIGDYALRLAGALRDFAGIETQFIVCDSAWKGPGRVEGFEICALKSRSSHELASELAQEGDHAPRVLLHYEGYGYANRGCPLWLVDAVEHWQRVDDRRSLMTLFHELYATGPPWTSSFWLSRTQRDLTTRLARLSKQCLTSIEAYAQIVRKMRGNGSAVSSMPVFSSIGEPKSPPPLERRRRRLVIFGTRGRRLEVYKRSARQLSQVCRALDVEEIVDIGKPLDASISDAVGVPVVMCGELPATDVSELLLDSIAGVIDYPAAMLAKSTIFAAYCSHRIIPIVANNGDPTPQDGLQANTHYWLSNSDAEGITLHKGQTIADNAFDWYGSHALSAHAVRLATSLDYDSALSTGVTAAGNL